MRHNQERREKTPRPRSLQFHVRQRRGSETAASQSWFRDAYLSPWENSPVMKQIALGKMHAGPPLLRLAGLLQNRRAAIEIWVLQKNSGTPKRVRAVATSDAEMSELDTCNREFENSSLYAWQGHKLLGRRGKLARGTAPRSVHALVRTARALHEPGIESQVSVDEVYSERSAAERAVAARRRLHPDCSWAVITYPVGMMLF